jgi:hypothetical protein
MESTNKQITQAVAASEGEQIINEENPNMKKNLS